MRFLVRTPTSIIPVVAASEMEAKAVVLVATRREFKPWLASDFQVSESDKNDPWWARAVAHTTHRKPLNVTSQTWRRVRIAYNNLSRYMQSQVVG